MNNLEAKELIRKKALPFKEHAMQLIDAFWEVENNIDFLPNDTKSDSYQVEHITIVDGNLEIEGLLEDAVNDHSLLIVLGDLSVDRAIIMSEVIVTGNFIIREIAVFDSLGDYTLNVGGDLIAKGYIESDHHENIKGKCEMEKAYSRGEDPNGILVPECISEGEYHNFVNIAKRIRDKQAVFV
ncbi:hypothetical protein AAG747_26525 [Rapidithrix thailandica]|uniref:Polymer-forming cytoskeletal protein n=1 Tax=Rapidithrix thailandica TaxID=413964 RepID=A0AAW9SKX0_9BACT